MTPEAQKMIVSVSQACVLSPGHAPGSFNVLTSCLVLGQDWMSGLEFRD